MDTITVYRAINERELTETAQLNNLSIDDLQETRTVLDFYLHQGTSWDHSPDNWAGSLLRSGQRSVIVEFKDEVIGNYETKHLDTMGDWAINGHFIWATAKISANSFEKKPKSNLQITNKYQAPIFKYQTGEFLK
jgi:hypothetical protein